MLGHIDVDTDNPQGTLLPIVEDDIAGFDPPESAIGRAGDSKFRVQFVRARLKCPLNQFGDPNSVFPEDARAPALVASVESSKPVK